MAVIKDKLISDLELRLSKFKPHIDLDINRSLLEFWIDSSRDPLVYQKIIGERRIKGRNTIAQEFIDEESLLSPTLNAVSGKYVITPTNGIMQLPNDDGIVQIINKTNSYVLTKTDYDEVSMLGDLLYAKPSITKMFWYRDTKGHIIIEGADATTVAEVLILKYVRANWGEDTIITAVYPITSDLIDPLLDAAEAKGIKTLQYGMTDVVTNDIPQE